MITTRLSALVLAAVVGGSAVAHAQDLPPFPSPPGGMPGGMQSSAGPQNPQPSPEMMAAATMKSLHDMLNIRPDQEQAFQAFALSMKPDVPKPNPREMGVGLVAMAGMTTPERVDAMGRVLEAKVHEQLQQHGTAVKAFYAVLSPDKRRTLDALPNLLGGVMGMAMGMKGPGGGPGTGMQ
jgi:hypothetical protein